MDTLVTIPPYAPWLPELAGHPLVAGGRFNTVMPIRETGEELLKRLARTFKNQVVIDLKCRQIRTIHGFFFKEPESLRTYEIEGKTYVLDPSNPRTYGTLRTPPWATIKISRKIKLDFSQGPVQCWFQDGYDTAYIAQIIDGDELIMLNGPKKVVGGGESINILHPSLEIEGFLTDLDHQYLGVARKLGLNPICPSYVESDDDLEAIFEVHPEAQIIAKIESQKGLNWVETGYPRYKDRVRLMAARGDLYVEVGTDRPDRTLEALKIIIRADPDAIVASRLLTSLRDSPRPTLSDITDVGYLLGLGYQHFMVGDDICFNRECVLLALDIMKAIGDQHESTSRSTVVTTAREASPRKRIRLPFFSGLS